MVLYQLSYAPIIRNDFVCATAKGSLQAARVVDAAHNAKNFCYLGSLEGERWILGLGLSAHFLVPRINFFDRALW